MTIRVQDVAFTYPSGVEALRGVDLNIRPGDRLALVGENGAGKTTLAKHLNGLLKPSRGRVVVGDEDTRQRSVAQLARRVGYVFQNPDEQLFQTRLYDEVAFGPRNLGQRGEALERGVESALEAVGLLEKADLHPYDLLPSERKLLGLASVLSMETPVIVLDEPIMGLDLHGISRVVSVLERWFQGGRTVVIISHNLDFCAEHFSRFVVMAQGRIQADGPPERVFSDEDLLARSGLEPPQLVRLGTALGFQQRPGKVEDFLTMWRERKARSL